MEIIQKAEACSISPILAGIADPKICRGQSITLPWSFIHLLWPQKKSWALATGVVAYVQGLLSEIDLNYFFFLVEKWFSVELIQMWRFYQTVQLSTWQAMGSYFSWLITITVEKLFKLSCWDSVLLHLTCLNVYFPAKAINWASCWLSCPSK